MNVSIILPILNEEAGIKKTITAILEKTEKFCSKIEILAIDDGSTDKTPSLLKQLQKKNSRIKIITHSKNLGYGAALRSGIKNAEYDWVFFIDADMQFDPSELKGFLDKTKNYDFIIGFRKKRADPFRRILISGVYNRIIRLLFGLKVRDVDCAFKLMRKTAARKIPFNSNSFFVSVEFIVKAYKMKYRITELGVNHFPRTQGNSKVTPRQIINSILDLLRLYRSLKYTK